MSHTTSNKRPAEIDINEKIAEAKRRRDEIAARLKATKETTTVKTPIEIVRERVKALKKRTAEKSKALGDLPSRNLTTSNEWNTPKNDASGQNGGSTAAGGTGLAISIHPDLLGDMHNKSRYMAKSKMSGKKRQEIEEEKEQVNPYLSESVVPSRPNRGLNFNHNENSRPAMAAAKAMRQKEHLNAMKEKLDSQRQRIQNLASKQGLDETADIQVFAVQMPPEFEFWDEDLQDNVVNSDVITSSIVHPIKIEPPQEKLYTKPQELILTAKEQKKMRRKRRGEELKEKQDKIRLGLEPAPPPVLKHSNVMRIYGDRAVKDPTAVNAMVNRQIAERKTNHEAANAQRKLSKEQKEEKAKAKAHENAAMGIFQVAYKIALGKEVLHKKLRSKIAFTVRKYPDASGICVTCPSFTFCLVEGGDKATRKIKHILLDVIQWQTIVAGDGEIEPVEDEEADTAPKKDTTCTLIFQGQVEKPKLRKWMGVHEVENDVLAKELLTKLGIDNYWPLVKANNT